MYGPHEYYHNENNEPMFRGIKVINLAEMFEKEENYKDYTIDQFKEWLSKACLEEDWTYINEWGRLGEFDNILIENNDIIEYLFKLGMDPKPYFFDYLYYIEKYQNYIKEADNEVDNPIIIEVIDKCKEMLDICKKYMNS